MAFGKPGVPVEASIFIARPLEDIWKYVLELDTDKHWREGVLGARMTSAPPFGLGSTGVHTTAKYGEISWRITEFEEQRVMGWDFTDSAFEGSHGSYQSLASTIVIRPPDGRAPNRD